MLRQFADLCGSTSLDCRKCTGKSVALPSKSVVSEPSVRLHQWFAPLRIEKEAWRPAGAAMRAGVLSAASAK